MKKSYIVCTINLNAAPLYRTSRLPVLLCSTEEAQSSNVRREVRKLDTQAMYESWRKDTSH